MYKTVPSDKSVWFIAYRELAGFSKRIRENPLGRVKRSGRGVGREKPQWKSVEFVLSLYNGRSLASIGKREVADIKDLRSNAY